MRRRVGGSAAPGGARHVQEQGAEAGSERARKGGRGVAAGSAEGESESTYNSPGTT